MVVELEEWRRVFVREGVDGVCIGEEKKRMCEGEWLTSSTAECSSVESSGSWFRVNESDPAFFVSRFGLESNQRVV